jgi:hypothetical protein
MTHVRVQRRTLRLTLLAPDIVEAILDGRQPAELQLDDLLEGFPLEWQGQLRVVPDFPSPAKAIRQNCVIAKDVPCVECDRHHEE